MEKNPLESGFCLYPDIMPDKMPDIMSGFLSGFMSGFMVWGAPGWDRTSDYRIRNPMLYPLSYKRLN